MPDPTKSATPPGADGPARRVAVVALRLVAAAGVVWIGFLLLIDRWRAGEAAVVVAGLGVVGVHTAQRLGDQIVVVAPGGPSFLTDIEPLCSSLGVVLAFAAVAAIVATGDRRRRLRAAAIGAGIVVVCNLVRMTATVLVGVWEGPGEIEPFHDGIATAFAVVFVLTALALFVGTLCPPRRPNDPRSNSSEAAARKFVMSGKSRR